MSKLRRAQNIPLSNSKFILLNEDVKKIDLLKKKETKVLRFSWCDCANVIRTKGCYVSEFESTIKDGMAVCTGALVSVTIVYSVYGVTT